MAAPPQASLFRDRLPPYTLTPHSNRRRASCGGDITAIPNVTVFNGQRSEPVKIPMDFGEGVDCLGGGGFMFSAFVSMLMEFVINEGWVSLGRGVEGFKEEI